MYGFRYLLTWRRGNTMKGGSRGAEEHKRMEGGRTRYKKWEAVTNSRSLPPLLPGLFPPFSLPPLPR